MQNSEYHREEPLPLISVDPDTNRILHLLSSVTHFSTSVLSLGEHAAKLIKSLKNPIGVVSVAGYYRTGKSYLLNRMLLNRKRGFSTGDTVNACTKVKSVRV